MVLNLMLLPTEATALSISAYFAALPKEKGAERTGDLTCPHSDQSGMAKGTRHSQSSPYCSSIARVALESHGAGDRMGLGLRPMPT